MPISRSEFEHDYIAPELYAEQALRSFADTAFSLDELLEFAASEGRKFIREEMAVALSNLVKAEKLDCKELRGIVYYIYRRRPLGFRTGSG